MHISIQDKATLGEFVQRLAPHTNMSASRLKTAIAKSYQFKHITALEAALSPASQKASSADMIYLSEEEENALLELSYWLDDCVSLGDDVTFGDEKITPAQVLSVILPLVYPENSRTLRLSPDGRTVLGVFSDWCCKHSDNPNVTNTGRFTPADIHAVLDNLLNRAQKDLVAFGFPTSDEIEANLLKHFGFDNVKQLESELFLYGRAEDELIRSVKVLASSPGWTDAMIALNRAGFDEMAQELRAIQLASLRLELLDDLGL